jgi:nucleotide-binding universal stress UspA family protein
MSGPFSSILVYVDGSEGAFDAARLAVVLARRSGARLCALAVLNARALGDLVQARIFLEAERDEYRRDLAADCGRYLRYVAELGRRKGLEVEELNASGTVSAEIKAALLARGADLLVVGETAQVRSRRDELYDEVDRAVRSAPCSVLVAKGEDRIQELYDALD